MCNVSSNIRILSFNRHIEQRIVNPHIASVVVCVSDRNLNKSSASCVFPCDFCSSCLFGANMNGNDAQTLSMDYTFYNTKYAQAAPCYTCMHSTALGACIWFFPGNSDCQTPSEICRIGKVIS